MSERNPKTQHRKWEAEQTERKKKSEEARQALENAKAHVAWEQATFGFMLNYTSGRDSTGGRHHHDG